MSSFIILFFINGCLLVFNLCKFYKIGQAWAAATTEGLLIYSLDIGLVFDPFELELGVTPDTVKEMLQKQDYAKGIILY